MTAAAQVCRDGQGGEEQDFAPGHRAGQAAGVVQGAERGVVVLSFVQVKAFYDQGSRGGTWRVEKEKGKRNKNKNRKIEELLV